MFVNKMIRQCAWCEKKLGEKKVLSKKKKDPVTTHGICPECAKKVEADLVGS